MLSKLFALLACFVLLQTSSVSAQNDPNSVGSPGCGDPKIKFDVKTDRPGSAAHPDPGKALVYFIEDDTDFTSVPKPTTRVGVDGAWVGATHGDSYLSVSIAPGVHHLCASWQNHSAGGLSVIVGVGGSQGSQTAATHFTAEAGGVYYFLAKNSLAPVAGQPDHPGIPNMSLMLTDSDEGQLKVSRSKLSSSQPKK